MAYYYRADDSDCYWELVTPPTDEPISLAEAKLQARITQPNGDASIAAYVRTAREEAEDYMSRGLLTQTWKLALQCFADSIWLPRAAPLQSVTGISYYDSTGVLTTLPTTYYTVDTTSRPGRLTRAYNQYWPALQSDRLSGKVFITYVIGWTTPDLVPERIKQGIRMYVTYLDRNRDGLTPDGEKACDAAHACWNDQARWIPPGNVA